MTECISRQKFRLLKIVGHCAVKTATLAELRRPDTIVVNFGLSQNGLDDAATTRKMK